MNLAELPSRIALAFGIGLLIGLERGWHTREAQPGSRSAGVRTFAITGLLGGIVAALARNSTGEISLGGDLLLGIAFAAFAGVVAVFNRDENKAANTHSATTTIAALLTFMLGAFAILGDVRIAAASAVATAGILIIREELHEWIAKITLAEIQSGLILLAMTFIALPIMPDRSFDFLGSANPSEIWLIAIVLASVSFAGYVAVKLFGQDRGILLGAAAGGLVSSTAVVFAYAKRAASHDNPPQILAAGAALATGISFLRVIAVVAVLGRNMLGEIAPALIAAAVAAAVFAFITYFLRGKDGLRAAMNLRNPFAFWSVILTAASMGLLIVVGKFIEERAGAKGVIASAAAMGLFDVDAMVVSMSQLVRSSMDSHSGALAILTGVASNTLCKVVIGAVVGERRFAIRYSIASTLSIAGGTGVYFAIVN